MPDGSCWGTVRAWKVNRLAVTDDPAVLGEFSWLTPTLLMLPPLEGVEEAMGVGVPETELVVDAVVGVDDDVVDWDSQRVTRFII